MVGAGGQVRPGLAQLSFVGDAMFGIGELLSIIPAKCINWYIIIIFITIVIITMIAIIIISIIINININIFNINIFIINIIFTTSSSSLQVVKALPSPSYSRTSNVEQCGLDSQITQLIFSLDTTFSYSIISSYISILTLQINVNHKYKIALTAMPDSNIFRGEFSQL